MNTKTMRLPPRRVLTSNALHRKRKERDGFDEFKPSTTTTKLSKPDAPEEKPISFNRNRLLAGYLAHEYLTRGTLLGRPWDPVQDEAVSVSNRGDPNGNGEAEERRRRGPRQVEDYERYVGVANLLKTDGAHVPGIVNPTQLASFLQM
ncbi:hypothetical protein I3843_03G250700 [Carya illinoinensis]|uniref:Uncharacterized protein n=1 Tax=Carya illinoinensis TaxID=32201 RepID=A0A8T1R5X4_CARIL|nr:uncharacterized protein LOC122305372 [Carya illinoinensis]KAG2719261.1 hypothetical protein I3760_03G259400 [Carya illinoinensis]KAG6662800.1 hypothetical protein CIPAW_03G268100 [Carya illinoinensis]KAG6724401.1 hypothetical protein I3842_03G257500 [Carya illinoinensis]KAG7989671.1 hypothetical protein I3843_03G250700 [Carya illinoinensis]